MELNQIKQFRVIANTESISAAAELLYIAQPSLSHTLKRLEDELGTQLFDRRGKKICLNGAGRIFLKYCDKIMLALDSAQKEINEYNGKHKTDINIAVASTTLLIKDIVDNMRADHPRAIPHFYIGSNKDWDLKIFSTLFPVNDESSTTVITERIGVIFSKSHPFAAMDEITAKDIKNSDILSLDHSDDFTKMMEQYWHTTDLDIDITMYAETPSMLCELVKKGFGAAFAPQCTWHCYYKDALEFRPISDMPMTHYVHLAINNERLITQDIQSYHADLIKFYIEYAKSYG